MKKILLCTMLLPHLFHAAASRVLTQLLVRPTALPIATHVNTSSLLPSLDVSRTHMQSRNLLEVDPIVFTAVTYGGTIAVGCYGFVKTLEMIDVARSQYFLHKAKKAFGSADILQLNALMRQARQLQSVTQGKKRERYVQAESILYDAHTKYIENKIEKILDMLICRDDANTESASVHLLKRGILDLNKDYERTHKIRLPRLRGLTAQVLESFDKDIEECTFDHARIEFLDSLWISPSDELLHEVSKPCSSYVSKAKLIAIRDAIKKEREDIERLAKCDGGL